MFGGCHNRSTLADGSGKPGVYDLVHVGFYRLILRKVGSVKADAAVRGGGHDGKVYRSGGGQPHAAAINRLFDYVLKWINGKLHVKAFVNCMVKNMFCARICKYRAKTKVMPFEKRY